MGIFADPDGREFALARRSSCYVDKTGLLRVLNGAVDTPRRFFCVTRPRGFGKTHAAEMIAAYFSCGCSSEALFQGLDISCSPDFLCHLNRHHVIGFSVESMDGLLREARRAQEEGQDAGGPDFRKMSLVGFIEYTLGRELKDAFAGCSDWSMGLAQSLLDISGESGDHPRFVFIIDEWDHMFRTYPEDTALQEDWMDFLTSLFKSDITDRCISLAFLTGIFPIRKCGIQGQLNCFDEYTMVDPLDLAEYAGFTEEEVRDLCGRCGMDFAAVKKWYGGYHFTGDMCVYCPESVAKAVQERKVGNCWSSTQNCRELDALIHMDLDGLDRALSLLLRGESVPCCTEFLSSDLRRPESADDVLTVLVHLGWLACTEDEEGETSVSIPSLEIRTQFERLLAVR